MDTTKIGNITEGALLSSLMRSGRVVLIPFGTQDDYDIVFEEGGRFFKVQCKTAHTVKGVMIFNAYTVVRDKDTKKYHNRYYGEKIDFFGVYCPENGKCYLVPVSEITAKAKVHLRLVPPKNNQKKRILMAEDYELRE